MVGSLVSPSEAPSVHWAVPEGLDIAMDSLVARLEFYHECILLHLVEEGRTTVRMVSAVDVARALAEQVRVDSGLLPEGALWWGSSRRGDAVALWQPPRVRRVALQMEAFKRPRRFKLPMPGFVFACVPGEPPWVWAALERPRRMDALVYRAPLYNVFAQGSTCPGTQRYSRNVARIPGEFFASFFTETVGVAVSRKHGANLLALWEELDGQDKYPLDDLMPFGTLEKALEGLWM